MIYRIMDWLDGKKTYITSIAGLIWSGLYTQGVISKEQFEAGIAFWGFLSAIFLRAGMKKRK